ncbi:hypothetical protein AAK967_07860 [Atopobiaceae bacterium 24-176]
MEPFARRVAAVPDSQDVPVHLLAGASHNRARTRLAVPHRVPAFEPSLPSVLLVDAPAANDEPVHVVAPALYLLLRSANLGVAGAASLGCTMAANYLCDPASSQCLPREPLVCLQDIESLCRETPSTIAGKAVLEEALGAIADHSRSPMETALAVMLALKPSHGGMGLPKPVLNAEIRLDGELRSAVGGQRSMFVDLFWPDAGVGIEYDSTEFHNRRDQAIKDRQRQLASDLLGIDVGPWTSAVVHDERLFTVACGRLAKRLGIPWRLDDRYSWQRRCLRAAMLGPHNFW